MEWCAMTANNIQFGTSHFGESKARKDNKISHSSPTTTNYTALNTYSPIDIVFRSGVNI